MTAGAVRVARPATAFEFLERSASLRAADPVRTNVLGSVATGVAQGRRYEREHWFLLEQAGGVVGAALWTVPYRLLVGPMPLEAAAELGAHVRAMDEQPAGVIGPAEVATAVADGGGWTATQVMLERILVLGEYTPPPPVQGSARAAVEDDADLATDWLVRFCEDAGTSMPDPRENFLSRLYAYRFWEVDGEPVSMAAHAPLVDTPAGAVARIGPVFTPREHRRRGFAGAITASVVEHVLPQVSTVMLFTDAANPTSNGVYERLGFRAVAEVVDLDLG
jgi:predicted GNAT family acetyltransferase